MRVVRRSFAMARNDAPDSAGIPLRITTTVSGVLLLVVPLVQTREPQRPLTATPSEMAWTSRRPLAAPGIEQVKLVGNPSSSGPDTLRLNLPKERKFVEPGHSK